MRQGRRVLTVVDGGNAPIPSGDWVLGAGDTYLGTTQYQQGQTRDFFATGTSDTNGRITVYPTKDGTATGAALFSSIFGFSCIYRPTTAPTSPVAIPTFYVESVSSDFRTVVFRCTQGVNLSLLGATLSFGASGAVGNIHLNGLPV